MLDHQYNGKLLPPHWCQVKLGDACDMVMGQSPSSSTYNKDGQGLPFLQGKAEFTNLHPVASVYCTDPLKIAKKGSVLISVRAPVGDVNIADQDYIIGRGLGALLLKDGFNPFLFFSLLYNKERLKSRGSGTTFDSITKATLATFSIFLPPLPEQRAIAHILQTVQNAIQARRNELALERERKAALMQHLFTHGTRGEATKQTEIGEMPESWEITKFVEAVNIASGQVSPTEEPYKTMKHVGPENIAPDTGVLLETKTNEQLNITSGNYYFTPKDVLYSKIRPYLNKAALPSFEGTCSADMYPLRPNEKYFTRELLYFLMLSERIKKQIIAFQARTGIPKINREQLGSISLPRPSLSEQKEIATILEAITSKIAALEKEIALQEELFRALLEELMSGRLSALPLVEEKGGAREA